MLSATQKTQMANHSPVDQLATLLNQKRGVIKAVWDFAVQGGAIGSLVLNDDAGNPIVIPKGYIITQVYLDVVTQITAGDANDTVALQMNAANDLLSAARADNKTGISAGVPVGTAATMVKATADRNLLFVIATTALTAGKWNIFFEFVNST